MLCAYLKEGQKPKQHVFEYLNGTAKSLHICFLKNKREHFTKDIDYSEIKSPYEVPLRMNRLLISTLSRRSRLLPVQLTIN